MGDISNELIDKVREAIANKRPLSIIGGGSKTFMGRKVSKEARGETLAITGHSGIVDYQPTELVLTARAGTSIEEITQTLEESGQICAFEPPMYDGKATLGGTLACNLSGPARPWRGSIRDAVLGVRLVNGVGEHLKFGGQVMKNVAGYDVSRLQAGAMGTLGAITEISFKVLPKPAATVTLTREMDAADAIRYLNQLMGKPVPLSGAVWNANKLYLRLEGAERAVSGTIKRLGGDATTEPHPVWENIREQSLGFFAGEDPTWRFSIDANARHTMEDQRWLIDWGGAQRWLRGTFDKTELESTAQKMGGHVSLFRHGNRAGDVFNTLSPPMQKIQQNLKNAFDPEGIFNPGRMYSWL